ncbi:MAG: hypothetical protein WC763_06285 [Candidatus Paceibacterota bacterium]|jgi:hypothetical protein
MEGDDGEYNALFHNVDFIKQARSIQCPRTEFNEQAYNIINLNEYDLSAIAPEWLIFYAHAKLSSRVDLTREPRLGPCIIPKELDRGNIPTAPLKRLKKPLLPTPTEDAWLESARAAAAATALRKSKKSKHGHRHSRKDGDGDKHRHRHHRRGGSSSSIDSTASTSYYDDGRGHRRSSQRDHAKERKHPTSDAAALVAHARHVRDASKHRDAPRERDRYPDARMTVTAAADDIDDTSSARKRRRKRSRDDKADDITKKQHRYGVLPGSGSGKKSTSPSSSSRHRRRSSTSDGSDSGSGTYSGSGSGSGSGSDIDEAADGNNNNDESDSSATIEVNLEEIRKNKQHADEVERIAKQVAAKDYQDQLRTLVCEGFTPHIVLTPREIESYTTHGIRTAITKNNEEMLKVKNISSKKKTMRFVCDLLYKGNRFIGSPIKFAPVPASRIVDEKADEDAFKDTMAEFESYATHELRRLYDRQVAVRGSPLHVESHPLIAIGSHALRSFGSQIVSNTLGVDVSSGMMGGIAFFGRNGFTEDEANRYIADRQQEREAELQQLRDHKHQKQKQKHKTATSSRATAAAAATTTTTTSTPPPPSPQKQAPRPSSSYPSQQQQQQQQQQQYQQHQRGQQQPPLQQYVNADDNATDPPLGFVECDPLQPPPRPLPPAPTAAAAAATVHPAPAPSPPRQQPTSTTATTTAAAGGGGGGGGEPRTVSESLARIFRGMNKKRAMDSAAAMNRQ